MFLCNLRSIQVSCCPFLLQAVGTDGISVDGKIIKVVSARDPLTLPWKDMDIDLVIEGTGVFVDSAGAGKHLKVGVDIFWLHHR